ncbi:MAG: hypothetical protein H7321_07210 [Bacteroidia bacterium]|nr:hypothetical protein [Bacteroidia bacterium]
MKKLFVIAIAAAAFASCNSNTKEGDQNADSMHAMETPMTPTETPVTPPAEAPMTPAEGSTMTPAEGTTTTTTTTTPTPAK